MTHDHTFHGLHYWHKQMFEKLGWILLAVHRGQHPDKIKAFSDALNQFGLAVANYIATVPDLPADRLHDLNVMKSEIDVLQQILTTCSSGNVNAVNTSNTMVGGKRKVKSKAKSKAKSNSKPKRRKYSRVLSRADPARDMADAWW